MKLFVTTLFISLFFSYGTSGQSQNQDQKLIKVAVIDTGFDFKSNWTNAPDGLVKPKLCKDGHKDFTGEGIQDSHGHGTHVAGIIAKHAKDANYCLVIIKAFDLKNNALTNSVNSLKYAEKIGVDIINYSAGGSEFYYGEYEAVQSILNKGIKLVAAAGNEKTVLKHHVLDSQKLYRYDAENRQVVYGYKVRFISKTNAQITTKSPDSYYPAMYDTRVISVANYNANTRKFGTRSNRGPAVSYLANGENVVSLLPGNKWGKMSGTSQAAPKVTATLINTWQ